METLSLLVEIDGERFALAGSDDWGTLDVEVLAIRGDQKHRRAEDQIEVTVRGLCEQSVPGEHYGMRWGTRSLKLGSKVSVTVLASATHDLPLKRYRSDSTVTELPFTEEEMKAMRYQDYLALKKEFEQDA